MERSRLRGVVGLFPPRQPLQYKYWRKQTTVLRVRCRKHKCPFAKQFYSTFPGVITAILQTRIMCKKLRRREQSPFDWSQIQATLNSFDVVNSDKLKESHDLCSDASTRLSCASLGTCCFPLREQGLTHG